MKVVFLDRDGVINQFPGHGNYVTKLKDFHFIPGSKKAIASLTKNKFHIFIISNQAGVGRGIFTDAKLKQIDTYLHKHIKAAGGRIDRSFYCTHHPDAKCGCRKPGIDNVKKAAATLGKKLADLKGNFFVGDSAIDIQAGKAAGLQTILVLSGKNPKPTMEGGKPDYVVANLNDAVKIILDENISHSRHSRGRS